MNNYCIVKMKLADGSVVNKCICKTEDIARDIISRLVMADLRHDYGLPTMFQEMYKNQSDSWNSHHADRPYSVWRFCVDNEFDVDKLGYGFETINYMSKSDVSFLHYYEVIDMTWMNEFKLENGSYETISKNLWDK